MRRMMSRVGWSWLIGVILAFGTPATTAELMAQEASAVDKEDKTLRTRDGWPIHVTYYPSHRKQDASVVVLLHMKGGNRLVWTRKGGFAEALQKQGHAVIAVDLRKHGQSKKPALGAAGKKKSRGKKGGADALTRFDYARMVNGDLEAVKRFIYEEHQARKLNMRKLAIVGSGMSAPVAIHYTALDWQKKPHPDAPTLEARTPRGQDVQALVLLSPELNLPGMPTTRAVRFIRPRVAFLICVGNSGTSARVPLRDARKLYKQLSPVKDPEKKTKWINELDVPLQGTNLIGKSVGTEKLLISFLDRYIGKLNVSWRNRQSRAAR